MNKAVVTVLAVTAAASLAFAPAASAVAPSDWTKSEISRVCKEYYTQDVTQGKKVASDYLKPFADSEKSAYVNYRLNRTPENKAKFAIAKAEHKNAKSSAKEWLKAVVTAAKAQKKQCPSMVVAGQGLIFQSAAIAGPGNRKSSI